MAGYEWEGEKGRREWMVCKLLRQNEVHKQGDLAGSSSLGYRLMALHIWHWAVKGSHCRLMAGIT